MSDAAASSWITDHAFTAQSDEEWWKVCAICQLAEAAHERTTLDDKGNLLHEDVAMFTHGLTRTPDGEVDDSADSGRPYALPGVGSVGKPPAHYATDAGMDVFDVVDAFGLDYFEGNAVKYILRWRKKGGVADLKKAQHYIEEIIIRTEATQ